MLWKPEYSRRNGRERYRRTAKLIGHTERIVYCVVKQCRVEQCWFVLVVFWPDCVDDVLNFVLGQISRTSVHTFADLDWAVYLYQVTGVDHYLRSAGSLDCGGDSTTVSQVSVGCVDDCIDLLVCDVTHSDFNHILVIDRCAILTVLSERKFSTLFGRYARFNHLFL